MEKKNIVVLDGYTLNPGDLSWDALKEIGNCTIYDRTSKDDVVERCKEADIVLTNKVIIGEKEMEQLPRLRYIGVLATGYNVVDTAAASLRGIVVTNIPAYSTDSVAQMVFAHLLNIVNAVQLHSESVRQGDWCRSADFSYMLSPQSELSGQHWQPRGKHCTCLWHESDSQDIETRRGFAALYHSRNSRTTLGRKRCHYTSLPLDTCYQASHQ